MKRTALRKGGLLVLSLLALSAQAEIYKWVDADGHVQYTDTPPPATAKKETVKLHSSSGVSNGVTANTPHASPSAKDQTAQGPKPVYDKETAAKNCEIANKNLEASALANTVNTKDANGDPQVLTGPQVAEWRKKLEEERDHWCNLAQ